MKIKVCHITTVHPAFDNRIFFKECKTLAAAGYEVHLLVANGKSETVDGITIHGNPVKFKNRLRRILKAPFTLLKAAKDLNAEVYHFHDPEFLLVAKSLIRIGKKVIYDVHEDLPQQIKSKYYLPSVFKNSLSYFIRKYEMRVAAKMSGIVTTVPVITQRFCKINFNTIEVCNYPDLEQMPTPESWENKTQSICYVGGLTVVRGITELIDAMENVDATLHVAGTFSPSELQNVCESKSGWHKVAFHGFQNRKGVQQIYATSKIGMVTLHPIPNYLDAYPVKMFEYMAAGIPVVCSDIPLWKSIIDKNDCGIAVDPKNADAISNGINTLLSDEQRMQLLGANGRKAVEEKYNWSIEAKKLVALYQKLLQ